MDTTLGIGSEKGGFLLRREGGGWTVEGPLFPGWRVTAFGSTVGGHLAAVGSNWFGPAIHRSSDLSTWSQVIGPEHQPGRSLEQIWTFTEADGRIYTGVAEAGVFVSEDGGDSWQPLDALNRFPGHESWSPGLGGLAAHRILVSGDTLWVGISAVGVFRSTDGGGTFVRCDTGVSTVVEEVPDGFCVHGLAQDPDHPDLIWRQDHSGVYRTEDGGDRWARIENGLPSSFGFAMVRDGASGHLFVVPLESDGNRLPANGRFCAYRSRDGGESWEVAGSGWPEMATYTAVLRGAAATDGAGGVFLGTTGGTVWATEDAGDHWEPLPFSFPRINAVTVLSVR